MIQIGDTVPKVALPVAGSTDGDEVSLGTFSGRWVVLYFYPKDNTPGCTRQAQDFRDRATDFDKASAVIIGVSKDSLKKHQNFRAKHDLPFSLITDADEQLCRAFDVIKLKKMYGREFEGIERSTFIIDPQGRVAAQWRKVKVDGHVDDVLHQLNTLQTT